MSPDLALALALADAADAISLGRFRASDLLVETKPDRTPVTEADRAVEQSIRERLASERPDDGMLGEEFGVSGGRRPALDRRPDRRHAQLLARDPGLGDADRARGGRRDPARRRLGAGARAPLVGRAWRGRVRERRSDPRLPRRRGRGCGAVLRARAAAAGDRAALLAPTCLRRFLGAHARRRGRRRRRDRCGRRQASGISPRSSRSSRRPADGSATGTASRGSTAAPPISSNGSLHEGLLEPHCGVAAVVR